MPLLNRAEEIFVREGCYRYVAPLALGEALAPEGLSYWAKVPEDGGSSGRN
jgi:hypothetical protein